MADDTNSTTAGMPASGRGIYAEGTGAHGRLRITGDVSRFTRARALQPGADTPLVVRFSGLSGAAGAGRDVRGFAVRFHTDEGNWDLVGNNTPVFFIRDPLRFHGLVKALRRPADMWNYLSRTPESLHQITMLMSDRGQPAGPMHMNGYGGHTYSFWNHKAERFWVKFHFRTRQGHAASEGGGDMLAQAIARGRYPQWTVAVQIMPEADADRTAYDPFDLTKVWPQGDYPLVEIGVIALERNPDDYAAEIGAVAFSPSNIVPGIGHSPDRMLQARVFSYAEAHRDRLGADYEALPANAVRGTADVHPDAGAGTLARDRHGRPGNDDFSQPRALFALFDEGQKRRLYSAIALSMRGVPEAVVARQCGLFAAVHPDYAVGVRAAIAAVAADHRVSQSRK